MTAIKIYTATPADLSPPVQSESFCVDLVLASDYRELEAKCAALVEALEKAQQQIQAHERAELTWMNALDLPDEATRNDILPAIHAEKYLLRNANTHISKLERANVAQDDHINQQQDRIDTLEKRNAELGGQLSRYSVSPGQADQRTCESRAVRDALGFGKDADNVAPIDLRERIDGMRARIAELEAAEKRIAELSASHSKLRDTMAGIHNKDVRTQLVFDALRRRADYYAELESMTPEQRADHDAGIAEFKAMLQGSQPVSDCDELPCAQVKAVADLYALCWQSGEVVTYTPDSEKAAIWLNNYSGTCVQEYVKLERFQGVVSGNSPVQSAGDLSSHARGRPE